MSRWRELWRWWTGRGGRAIEQGLAEQRVAINELRRQAEKNANSAKKRVTQQHKTLQKELQRISAMVGELDSRLNAKEGLANRIERCRRQIDDMARRDLIADYPFGDPARRLWSRRASLYSQNGEDGVVLELIRAIGNPHRKTVEMCCGDNGGNSGALVFELGWSGLLVDGDEGRLERLRDRHDCDPARVRIQQAWLTCENVNDLIRDAGMSGPVDLLSIDLDGVDYWLWQRIDACTPDIVIAEYNASFGPDRSVTVPYDPEFTRPKEFRLYYGASLTALARLGEKKGYRLIGVEPRGVNAFFLRDELLAEEYPAVSPAVCYRTLDKHLAYQKKKGYTDFFAELEERELPVEDVAP